MYGQEHWHRLIVPRYLLKPQLADLARIPRICTWCAKPGIHGHPFQAESSGLQSGVGAILGGVFGALMTKILPMGEVFPAKFYLCHDCHNEQRKKELTGWGALLGGLAVMFLAVFIYSGQPVVGTVSVVFSGVILLVIAGLVFSGYSSYTARLRKGIILTELPENQLALFVKAQEWVEEFASSNPTTTKA